MQLYLLLFSDLLKRLRWRFPVLVSLTVLVGIGEGTSVVLLLPLLSRVGIAAVSDQGAATRLIDKILSLLGANSTVAILAVVIAVTSLQTVLALALNWWSVRLARSYQARRQLEMFRAFMRAKWSFLTGRKAGELRNAIIAESDRLGRAFTYSFALLGSAIIAAIYVLLSVFVAWQATVSLICFAALVAMTMTRLYRKSYALGREIAPLNAQLQSLLDEQFAGAKFIKASGGIDRATDQIEPLLRKLQTAKALTDAMPVAVRGILEYIAFVGLAVILVLASKGMGVAPANVVIVLALFGRLFPRLTAVQAQVHYLNANIHALEAINALQRAAEAEAERRDRDTSVLKIDKPAALQVRDLQVELGGRVILDEINLTLAIPGLLAIVGKSGAGKSTLVHTLLGLIEPGAGSIRLGPHELASTPLTPWRRAIGYAPQETVLFHASIRDNLIMLNPAASEADIVAATQQAHALDFINLQPKGFDTVIGDQGVRLSGGQRQRLGIARALLANPSLLILDEAMSALDGQSEAELLGTIEDLRKQIGILIVAHRLAAVQSADRICVMEAGRIVERGTWTELMDRKAHLYALAESQSLADGPPMAVL
jgi:ABC-type multidrug transport system fused ATPase/permease subunit